MNRASPEQYAESFQNFLSCTNEKQVFLDLLRSILTSQSATSLLDIGAGNGDLAIPLSRLIHNYIAIEPVHTHVERLRTEGITVVESFFPCPVEGQFDIVLSCHSLPGNEELYKSFIQAAWDKVKIDGVLLLVTYDDWDSEWSHLLDTCGLEWGGSHTRRLSALKSFLNSVFTHITQEEIVTKVSSPNLEICMHALDFVYSEGRKERSEKFMTSEKISFLLQSQYKTSSNLFSFPFTHYLFKIKKTDR